MAHQGLLKNTVPLREISLISGIDADLFSFPGHVFKLDNPWNFRKQGVIATNANVLARMKRGSALPDQNLPCFHQLSAISFNAQPLADTVSAVCCASLSLFMCHIVPLILCDIDNFKPSVQLSVPVFPPIFFATLLLENDDFFALQLLRHFASNGTALKQRRTRLNIVAVANQQNFFKSDGLAFFPVNFFNLDHVPFGNCILFPAC